MTCSFISLGYYAENGLHIAYGDGTVRIVYKKDFHNVIEKNNIRRRELQIK